MNEADETPEKRRSLLRFGKRRSLFRFGKRGSILRFGKRSGYAPYTSDDYLPYYPSQSFDGPRDFDEFGLPEKRSTLFRFGKKSSGVDMKDFERDNSKKPHTPWRFGREEEEEDLSSEKTD
ncbi:hypothetical protein DPMN_079632 [Dreissena polymorpha]|uniref:Uncharacterized protein n=2 Tax=Dreissena polymorpha TaxID=45954 RepID=A0A9D3YTI4_DREPO|nr:hypothetical protein DPMN_079632 [Dreissena polymorpha]